MISHYLTIALRTLWRNRFHSFINITGLAVGISACLVIYLIVSFELSFNEGIPQAEHIYRIHSKFSGAVTGLNRGAPTAVAGYVKENFKGIDRIALFFVFGSEVELPDQKNKKLDRQRAVALAGPDYFDVFGIYSWTAGTVDALTKPFQVVLTESQAQKYFGTIPFHEMLGRPVIYRDSIETTVAGIVGVPRLQTDLEFTDFISKATIEAAGLQSNYPLNDWGSINSSTQVFIRAQPTTTHRALLDQLPQLSKIYNEQSTWSKNEFDVQPLTDLHFSSETGIFDFSRAPAHRPTLLTLSLIAVLLLVMGAINFINLETAQAARRSREVGVRKVMGSTRSRLTLQFMGESLVVTLAAMILALPMTEVGLTYFEDFVPQGVSLSFGTVWPFLFATAIFIGLLASAYPAVILSSFMPVLALKNQAHLNSPQSRTAFLRRTLIVVQFTVAQVLIIGMLMMSWQIKFLLEKDLGFDRQAVVYFDAPWQEDQMKSAALHTELKALPEIAEIALSDDPPSAYGWSSSTIEFGTGNEPIQVNAYRKYGDTSYLPFYRMKLLAGRNLQASDTVKEFIINETLMKRLGIESAEAAIGQELKRGKNRYPIAGVVADFHFESLHKTIEPVIISCEAGFKCFNIRFSERQRNGTSLEAALAKVEAAWKKIYPEEPFDPKFLDETIRSFYKTELRMAKLASTAVALAIFISCLGLFGLASFTSVQRTKEIGVRKILGASTRQIVLLLSRDFLLLVVIAFFAALPIGNWAVNEWLQRFTYHTHMNPWLFAGTMLLAVATAFVTVSYHTWRAANSNPAESLKSE
jgi:hypothetical protein